MPDISIIIPCYNEESTIRLLLDAVYAQTYPRNEIEVVIADGGSSDGTAAQIQAFQNTHPDLIVHVVPNPRRVIPSALNAAIHAAQGNIIVRLDAHSVPQPDYVARCKDALDEGKGENVGGVWDIRPGGQDWQARSIAAVAAHPLGVGDALYRYTSQAREVDTVPFGCFRRSLVEKIGEFDETLLTNEDYEFNTRVRQSGGKVWLDPNIRSVYFARSSFTALARQYWRYGYWKLRMLKRYPGTVRWRQALPPVFVFSLLGLALLAPWWSLARELLAVEAGIYLVVLSAAGIQMAAKKKDLALAAGIPLGIATMHLSWGSGFLWSLITSLFDRTRK